MPVKNKSKEQLVLEGRRLLLYVISALVCLALDAIGLSILVTSGLHYLLANTISFTVATLLFYYLNIKIIFPSNREKSHTIFIAFIFVGILGLLIQNVVLMIAISEMELDLLLSKFISIGFSFGISYLIRRKLLT